MKPGDLIGQFHHATVRMTAAADVTEETVVFRCPRPCRIKRVTLQAGAAITGADTHTKHVNVRTITAAGVATERGNRDFVSGTDEVAYVARDYYAPATPLSLAAGAMVSVQVEKVGNGIATPPFGVTVEWDEGA